MITESKPLIPLLVRNSRAWFHLARVELILSSLFLIVLLVGTALKAHIFLDNPGVGNYNISVLFFSLLIIDGAFISIVGLFSLKLLRCMQGRRRRPSRLLARSMTVASSLVLVLRFIAPFSFVPSVILMADPDPPMIGLSLFSSCFSFPIYTIISIDLAWYSAKLG